MSMVYEIPARQPRIEEVANTATHAVGFALSLVGTAALLRVMARYGDTEQMIGVSVYGATLMALYAASTLSHTFERPRLRHFFRTVDQVCIFLLIAGTFTPIALTYMRDGWGWALFISMWGLALVGIFTKIFFARLQTLAISSYVLLGWLPAIAIKPILEIVPAGALTWMVIGGLFYTVGTLFLMRDDRVPFFHATWHVFVILGSACHYFAVMRFVVPWPAA